MCKFLPRLHYIIFTIFHRAFFSDVCRLHKITILPSFYSAAAAKSPHINVRWGWVSKFLHFCYCFIVWLAMISFNPNVFLAFWLCLKVCQVKYTKLHQPFLVRLESTNSERELNFLWIEQNFLTQQSGGFPLEAKIIPSSIVDYFPSRLWKVCLYRDHVLSFHVVTLNLKLRFQKVAGRRDWKRTRTTTWCDNIDAMRVMMTNH